MRNKGFSSYKKTQYMSQSFCTSSSSLTKTTYHLLVTLTILNAWVDWEADLKIAARRRLTLRMQWTKWALKFSNRCFRLQKVTRRFNKDTHNRSVLRQTNSWAQWTRAAQSSGEQLSLSKLLSKGIQIWLFCNRVERIRRVLKKWRTYYKEGWFEVLILFWLRMSQTQRYRSNCDRYLTDLFRDLASEEGFVSLTVNSHALGRAKKTGSGYELRLRALQSFLPCRQ